MPKNYRAKHIYRNIDVANNYDGERFTNYIGRLSSLAEKKAVIKLANTIPQPNIFLDIPAGTGRFSELLSKLNKSNTIVGADISREMLKKAKTKLENHQNVLGLVQCDAEHLPFKENAFGGIVCVRLMGHLPPSIRINVEKELGRVTNKWAIVSYANPLKPLAIYRRIKALIKGYPWHQLSKRTLKDEISNLGLVISKSTSISLVAETYMVLLDKKKNSTELLQISEPNMGT